MATAKKKSTTTSSVTKKSDSSNILKITKILSEVTGIDIKTFEDFDNEPDGELVSFGNYMMNMVLGASFKGVPRNKVITYGGEPGGGKTYFSRQAMKAWFREHDFDSVLIFESEGASTSKSDFIDAGFTPEEIKKIILIPLTTVQNLKHYIMNFLKNLEKIDNVPNIGFILDSIGNVASQKEIDDSEKGSDKEDQTRNRKFKSLFRSIASKLSKFNIPFIILAHSYKTMDFFPQDVISAGSGAIYASSVVVLISRKQYVNSKKEQIGNIIKIKVKKGRYTRQNKIVEIPVRFDKGINRMTGLPEFLEENVDKLIESGLLMTDGEVQVKEVVVDDNEPEDLGLDYQEILDDLEEQKDKKKKKKKFNKLTYKKDDKEFELKFSNEESVKDFFLYNFEKLDTIFSEDFALKNDPTNY